MGDCFGGRVHVQCVLGEKVDFAGHFGGWDLSPYVCDC